MSNLTSSWDNSRKLLFEAALSCEALPSPDCCRMCLKGTVRVRCMDCAVGFMCPSCDEKVHQFLPFHNRDGYLNGYFQAIPPTITLDDNGTMQTTCKSTIKWIGVNESDIHVLFNTYNNYNGAKVPLPCYRIVIYKHHVVT